MVKRSRRPPRVVVIGLAVLAVVVLLRTSRRVTRPPAARDLGPREVQAPVVPEGPRVQPPSVDSSSSSPLARFRAFYGAHPLHLLVLLASFALTGYAVSFLAQSPDIVRIAIWFAVAVVAHDLVLFPLYALADRSTTTALARRARRKTFTVPAVNFIRLPILASGLLFLIFLPSILQHGDAAYFRASGLHESTTYLNRWLLLTGLFLLLSAAAYSVRVARTSR